MHNQAVTTSATTFTEAARRLGTEATWSDSTRASFSDWTRRVRFDPTKAAETTLSSWLLFHYAMPSLIAYDLSVAPAHRIADGAREYWNATSDDERQAAREKIGHAFTGVSDNLAMFTAFYTPIGFAQDIAHETREGRLDVAAGKLLVTGGMMWSSAKMMYGAARSLSSAARNRAFYRGRPYDVIGEPRFVRARVAEHGTSSSPRLRNALGTLSQAAGAVTDAVLHPSELALRPAQLLREMASNKLGLGSIRVRADSNGAFTLELTRAQRDWIHEDLALGGQGLLCLHH